MKKEITPLEQFLADESEQIARITRTIRMTLDLTPQDHPERENLLRDLRFIVSLAAATMDVITTIQENLSWKN